MGTKTQIRHKRDDGKWEDIDPITNIKNITTPNGNLDEDFEKIKKDIENINKNQLRILTKLDLKGTNISDAKIGYWLDTLKNRNQIRYDSAVTIKDCDLKLTDKSGFIGWKPYNLNFDFNTITHYHNRKKNIVGVNSVISKNTISIPQTNITIN